MKTYTVTALGGQQVSIEVEYVIPLQESVILVIGSMANARPLIEVLKQIV